MQPDHQLEREIFTEVCELPTPDQRRARLTEICRGDETLERRIERMLEVQEAADTFFKPEEIQPEAQRAATQTQDLTEVRLSESPGTVVGRYKLLERIGEGGFGLVYLAEQFEPVRRRVALKIIKVGMDTREVIARFEAERQALALMDHPNIAHVLDAGATETGRPFFVMELVQGEPITGYCDRHRLTPRERLELFLPVCHAVQHAHQKGIIHRDLKPSNILVTVREGRPWPKVIDFGIAKATQQPLSEKTFFTQFGRMIGTPAYMSPEQAEFGGQDVDTRGDIYSLGVVLYELLTGKTPFDPEQLRKAGSTELQRILREVDPPRPSTRLRTLGAELPLVARHRRMEPLKLGALLRGDLDWIVMKALEKDRSRRYETVNALARDLERHLHEEPVQACPPTVAYRMRKFARRHRHAVAAAAGILLALVAGLLLATLGLLQARHQRDLAQAAERQAEQERALALQEQQRASLEAARARRIAYASDMNLAQHALDRSNLGRALQLLNRQRPVEYQEDLRGWEWRYLWQECQSDALFTLGSQPSSVRSLAVSPGGAFLVTGGMDGTARIWDLPARKLVATLPETGDITALSPDGQVLASSDARGGVTLWDFQTRRPLARLEDPDTITALAFSRDGRLLAGFVVDGAVCLWDLDSRKALGRYTGFPPAGLHAGDLAFTPSAERLVLGGGDGRIRLLDTATGAVVADWTAHNEGIMAIAVSTDGEHIASGAGYSDPTVRVWSTHYGELEASLDGHRAWISSVAFSNDDRTLASASADQTLRIWDLANRKNLATLRGHLHEVWSMAFLPDSTTLVSGGKDGVVNVWPMSRTSQTESPSAPPLRDVHFVADDTQMIGLDPDGRVVQWSMSPLRRLGAFDLLGLNNVALALAPRGHSLAVVHAGALLVCDRRQPSREATLVSPALDADAVSLEFTADAQHLVSVEDLRTVRVFESRSWKQIAAWNSAERWLSPIDISPDGRCLACGGDGVVIFDLLSGQLIVRFAPHQQPTDAVAYSPDGRFFATGSQEGLAKLWDSSTWQEMAVLRGHLLGVHAVAFSPDGLRLATGSVGSEAVKLWDLATRQEVLNLSLPNELITRLGFSPDGGTLVCINNRNGLRLWRAASWNEIEAREHTP